MIQRTRNLVKQWLSNRDPTRNVYILMDEKNKIGSRKWLYVECHDLLPFHTIINPKDKIKDNKNPEIVIIDDWSITGIDLMDTMDVFYQNNKEIKFSYITYIITYCSKEYFNYQL